MFGDLPVENAVGAILAHTLRVGAARFRKGRTLSAEDILALHDAGFRSVVAARLEAGDVAEDEAAARIAKICAGEGVRVAAAFTGRANLYADTSGLVVIDTDRVNALNAIDESITLATLAPYAHVSAQAMLATVKIIPFAAPRAAVAKAEALLAKPILRMAPFHSHSVALISTVIPTTKATILDRNESAVATRVNALGSTIVCQSRYGASRGQLGESDPGSARPDGRSHPHLRRERDHRPPRRDPGSD